MISKDSDKGNKSKLRLVGLVGGGISVIIFFALSSFMSPERALVITSIVFVFFAIIYIKRREIWNAYYISTLVVIFMAEIFLAFFINIPRIRSAAIAVLPVALFDFFLIDIVLLGVKKLFRLPDWRT
jgi:asparagine N-glycosylation enzyme membrane subunit Stt3